MNEVVVTTRSGLRGVRFFPAMVLATVRVRRQLARTPGVVRWASVLGGPTEFWTITVWRSRHEMQEFMRSGAHGELMWLFARWLRSFWLMRWGPGAARIGSWDGFAIACGEGSSAHRRVPFVVDDVRRPRADLSPAGGAVVRIRTSAFGLPRALRELRHLRAELRSDPRLLRLALGIAKPGELYLFAVWREREAAAALVQSPWVRAAAARWGEGFWAQEWLPENEFGHWDGLRVRTAPRVSAARPHLRRAETRAGPGGT
jgi:hypothetical protein